MITESVFFIEYRFTNEKSWRRLECMGPFFDPLTPANLAGRLAANVYDTDYRVAQYRRVDAEG